jgi:transcriptional regulator with GAF, ATPase, and Fis domain
MAGNDWCFIGESEQAATIRDEIALAAGSDAKVLVTGETGVGKEVVARLVYQQSSRRFGPMAMLNCAGLPDSLAESELFGHTRGSFTDAYREKAGIFETAAKGTVFLDEVGEMSPRIQAALLRFLETGEIQKIGAERAHIRVDVRVIAATNRDLRAAIDEGRFRLDLFYRLNVLHIHVPPLRERREDIRALLDHYLEHFCRHHHVPRCMPSPAVLERLLSYEWPGNVRQLKNVVERLVLKCTGSRIETGDLPRDVQDQALPPTDMSLAAIGEKRPHSVEDNLMSQMLDSGGSFWSVVCTPFKQRDLTRAAVNAVVSRGLQRTDGNYRRLVRLFNMPDSDYRRFLSFLRQHHCPSSFRLARREYQVTEARL